MSIVVRYQSPRNMISYFEHERRGSNKKLPDFSKDLKEILAYKINTIIFCVSEETLVVPELINFIKDAVRRSHHNNIFCMADPWGVGKFFGGEGVSEFAKSQEIPCFCNTHFSSLLTGWIHLMKDLNMDGIFWDEPEEKPGRSCPDHNEVAIINHFSQISSNLGFYNSVCLPSNIKRLKLLMQIGEIPTVNDIGTDPYWPNAFTHIPPAERLGYIAFWAKQVKQTGQANHKDFHLWLQGFNIKKADTTMTAQFTDTMRQNGITDLGMWGFKACASLFDNSNNPTLASPQEIWQLSKNIFYTFPL